MTEEARTIATLSAVTNAMDLMGQQREETLRQIADDLRIMLASATELHDGLGYIHGYKIKTGALHRILGRLAGVGHPVAIPAPAWRALDLSPGVPASQEPQQENGNG